MNSSKELVKPDQFLRGKGNQCIRRQNCAQFNGSDIKLIDNRAYDFF